MIYERVLMPKICGAAVAKLKRAREVKSIAERMLIFCVTSLRIGSLTQKLPSNPAVEIVR